MWLIKRSPVIGYDLFNPRLEHQLNIVFWTPYEAKKAVDFLLTNQSSMLTTFLLSQGIPFLMRK